MVVVHMLRDGHHSWYPSCLPLLSSSWLLQPSFVSVFRDLHCPPLLVLFLAFVAPLCQSLLGIHSEPQGELIFPIEGPLELNCCEHVSHVMTPTSTPKTHTCTSKNPIDQWFLLRKQQDFWKGKSCITITWAFYAPLSSFSNEVSSTSNLVENLKCFFCHLVAPLVGQKKGVIIYKNAN